MLSELPSCEEQSIVPYLTSSECMLPAAQSLSAPIVSCAGRLQSLTCRPTGLSCQMMTMKMKWM